MAWAYLETAPDQLTGELWIAILGDEGIAARIRPTDAISFLGISGFGCRVEVEQDELERARVVLDEIVTADG
jgi:hypothetical protein